LTLRNAIVGSRGQDALYVLTGPDGALEGPFNAMLVCPELGRRIQSVGEYIRFQGALPARLREFAILLVASDERSEYEWYAHASVARSLGLRENVLSEILLRRPPSDMSDEQRIVHAVWDVLRRDESIPDDVHGLAEAHLGLRGLVELLFLFGYYRMLALCMRAFDVGVPDGVDEVFREPSA
jgi:alkylhydroperoxidase family enzyme